MRLHKLDLIELTKQGLQSFFEGHPYKLKQNFPSQTCREWFIKLCACGPDFAAWNKWPAMMYNKYLIYGPLTEDNLNTEWYCTFDILFQFHPWKQIIQCPEKAGHEKEIIEAVNEDKKVSSPKDEEQKEEEESAAASKENPNDDSESKNEGEGKQVEKDIADVVNEEDATNKLRKTIIDNGSKI